MKKRLLLAGAFTAALLAVEAVAPSMTGAMPAFARKEGVDCATCHTTVPRLNEYGYKYRKAGYRDPSDIGKDIGSFNYADALSARIQARYDVMHRNGGSTNNQLTLHEITLYPLTGSFGSHWGSLMEVSAANEDFLEIENAYVRYTWGDENAWWSAKLGIFHPFEGYGASDRPFSLSRPFFQKMTTNNGQGSTFFHLWGFDQAGAELAYQKDHTTFSFTLFNGIFVTDDEGGYKAFPAAGGHLKKMPGFESYNSKDFQVMVNQALDSNGSGLSAYYYHGSVDLPMPGVASSDFGPASSFQNTFDRLAFYGSYVLSPQFEVMGGYAWTSDDYVPPDKSVTTDSFNGAGFFGEADFHPSNITTVGARYDYFDPSTDIDDNQFTGVTVFANVPLNDGFQVITEYQHKQQKMGSAEDAKWDNFQVRFIWLQ